MNRRTAVQRITALLGGVLSAPLTAGLLGQVINSGASVPLDAANTLLLAELADTIIPTTDTPGAKAAGVEQFIIRVLRDCYPKAEQDDFYVGLAKLDAESRRKFEKGFVELEPGQRSEILLLTARQNKPFFKLAKQLTVAGYFTSEIGATKALEYVPVPGRFQGDLPWKPGQKAWAI